LFADLRNQGNRNLRIALEFESWELEIDGTWHKTDGIFSGDRRYLPLAPGAQQKNLEVRIAGNLAQRLRALEPGKHTLRVARLIPESRPGDDVFRVVSERAEIEIAAPGPEAAKDRPPDSIRGRVLDHTGKPVAGAVVYLAGSKTIESEKLVVWDGKPPSLPGPAAETDQQGRFVLTRAGAQKNRLVVNSPGLVVWVVPLPEPGKEATITLPQPAALKIRCDIPGAGAQARFHLHLKTWEMEGWKGLTDNRQYTELTVANPGDSVLGNLTPGPYDLARKKDLRVGDYGMGLFCDHRDITLDAGKTVEADFVRRAGQPILGQVVGLKEIGVAGAFVFVSPPAAPDDPRRGDAFWNTLLDALTCGVDGQFKTETIPPGDYNVNVHAYGPDDGRFKVTAEGIDLGFRPGARWELLIDPDAAHMVRSAKMVDEKNRTMTIVNSGLKTYGPRCVPEKAECKGAFIDASFEIESASPEADVEFLKRAKAAMRPPYPMHMDVHDERVTPELYVPYNAGKTSPQGRRKDWDIGLEDPGTVPRKTGREGKQP
jgi:hypothetical protein